MHTYRHALLNLSGLALLLLAAGCATAPEHGLDTPLEAPTMKAPQNANPLPSYAKPVSTQHEAPQSD